MVQAYKLVLVLVLVLCWTVVDRPWVVTETKMTWHRLEKPPTRPAAEVEVQATPTRSPWMTWRFSRQPAPLSPPTWATRSPDRRAPWPRGMRRCCRDETI